MSQHWKSRLWRNTATNYIRTLVRFATGFFIFRALFQHFSAAQMGFWLLLWSVFAYTVLLDFGLGYTANREAARAEVSGDWDRLSRLMSTMLWSFIGIGVLVLLVFVAVRNAFLTAIAVPVAERASFSKAYWVFFGALAVAFPMGIFPEMLAGLQRVDLTNWAATAGSLLNLALVYVAMARHWPLEAFVLIGVGCALGPTFLSYWMVRHLMPALSLHPKLFHLPSLRGVLTFSLSVYVITLTNVIIAQTDQLVISLSIGVASVAIYQAGGKVSEMFGLLSQQMQGALDSATAHLHATGDARALRQLLVRSTRLVVLTCTPAYALAAAYLNPLIRLVTGLKHVDHASLVTGQNLLGSVYSSLLTTSCAKRVLTMAGWERPMLRVSVINAAVNLALSVALVSRMGVVGVAIGTIIPGVLTGWGGVVPLTLKFAEISPAAWLRDVYFSVLSPLAVSLAMLALLLRFWPLPVQASFAWVAVRGVLVMSPVMYATWKLRRELV